MATTRLQSGQCLSVIDAASGHAPPQTHTLVRSDALEVAVLGLTAGRHLARHQITGELTLHCLRGEVRIELEPESVTLSAGRLLYLAGGVPHALLALRDSELLLTMTRSTPPP